MKENGGELPPSGSQNLGFEGAEVVDFIVAQRVRDGKSLYAYGRVGDDKPPADNVRFVHLTPEGITIWRYTAIDPDIGIEMLGEKPDYTKGRE